MKYYSAVSLFKFSWDQVAGAFWTRYPNPYSTHVLTEDTVNRQVKKGKLVSRRLITKTNKLPKWGEMFVPGPKFVCVVEESEVDPRAKTLTTYTRNIGYTKLMVAEEKCVYRQSPNNHEWTQCERQVWITSSIFGFARAVQSFGIERFKKNAMKAVQGFEYVLNKMYMPESIPESPKLSVNVEKLKSKAKNARDLAKAKAVPVVASCTGKTAS